MKNQVTLTIWTGEAYRAVKRVVVPYEFGVDMRAAMSSYADEHGFTLALAGENGDAALYWNDTGQLVRMAIEEVG